MPPDTTMMLLPFLFVLLGTWPCSSLMAFNLSSSSMPKSLLAASSTGRSNKLVVLSQQLRNHHHDIVVRSVPIVQRPEFQPHTHYYHTTKDHNNPYDYETPVLVEQALSLEACESILGDTIVETLGKRMVQVQRKITTQVSNNENDGNDEDTSTTSTNKATTAGTTKQQQTTETRILSCELSRAFDFMMQSLHDDAYFCFAEGLLDNDDNDDDDGDGDGDSLLQGANDGRLSSSSSSLAKAREILRQAKESLFVNNNDTDDDDSVDLFDFFPRHAKPSDCVVIAGEGATSTLHRDPFTWTGTSLCLEGTKIWRFVAPPGAAASAAATAAMTTTTHDDETVKESSGVAYVDHALQSYRLPSVAWDDDTFLSAGWQSDLNLYALRSHDILRARELARMEEEEGPNEKLEYANSVAHNLELLSPCSDFPVQFGNGSPVTIWTVVQKPGDLLVIPAFWWHQTYAPEPSVAIASQRAGMERDTARVIRHVLETVGHDDFDNFSGILRSGKFGAKADSKAIVDNLFGLLSGI